MVMRYRIVYPDELNHYGVKGMKWGVRKENLKQNSLQSNRELLGLVNNELKTQKNRKIRKELKSEKKMIKQVIKEQKPVQKYSNKAEKQVSYLKNEEKMFRGKYGDHDDEKLFDSLSPAEKRRERKRFTESGKWAAKNAKYWDKAAKDISMSTSSKEAKEKFKKYRQNAEIYVVNP